MKIGKVPTWLSPILTFLVLGGVGYGAFRWLGQHESEGEHKVARVQPAVPVTLESVEYRPLRRSLTVVGSLWGWEELAITAKVEGRVRRVFREVGDRVKPGDVLLELDPVDHQLALNETRRGLELELAKLGLNELPSKEFDLGNLPMVARANSMKAQARTKADRLRRLQTTRAAAVEDLEQAETDLAVANSNHAQMLLEAQATLAAAKHRQAMLESAQQRLKDTKIIVPSPSQSLPGSQEADYAVVQRNVAEGEMVRVMPTPDAAPQYRLAIDRFLKLQVNVPERYLGEVKIGQDVELRVEAYPGEVFAAKLTRLQPAVDRASRTFKAEITVPNSDHRLVPGSFVRAEIVTNAVQTRPTVPEEAVVTFAGISKVFTVIEGRAKAITVTVGRSLSGTELGRPRTWVEIETELSDGTQIVTTGQSKLSEGTPVRIRKTGE